MASFGSPAAFQQAPINFSVPTPSPQPPALYPKYQPLNPGTGIPGVTLVTEVNASSPPIFYVPNLLSPAECSALISAGQRHGFAPSNVVGDEPIANASPGTSEGLIAQPKVSQARTSTTLYLDRADTPSIISRVTALLNVAPSQCELPQVAQYLPSQKYDAHFDAFDVSTPNGRAFCANGGQRIATVLIYLNDVEEGGRTSFPRAVWRKDVTQGAQPNPIDGGSFPAGGPGVSIKPRAGSAVVFFPSYYTYTETGQRSAVLDPLALHRAEDAVDVKYVSQVWIREGEYRGVPSCRLQQPI